MAMHSIGFPTKEIDGDLWIRANDMAHVLRALTDRNPEDSPQKLVNACLFWARRMEAIVSLYSEGRQPEGSQELFNELGCLNA